MNNNIIASYVIANVAAWVLYDDLNGDTVTSALSIIDTGIKYRRRTKIHETASGRAYIYRRGYRLYLDEFMRV